MKSQKIMWLPVLFALLLNDGFLVLLRGGGRLCIQIVKASGGRALFVTKGHKKLLGA